MKLKNLIYRLSALCAASLTLTGCVLGNSVEALLSPPEISEEQREIYSALVRHTGENITLQYPKAGSYRSAFIVDDLDKDGGKEALAFYISTSDGKTSGSLRLNLLDKTDNGWKSVCDAAGSGAGVERVLISELGDSGRTSIIIGYTNVSGDKNFHSYVYSGNTLNDTFYGEYSSMFIADLNSDGLNELSVIHPNNAYTNSDAYFSLVTDDGSTVYESSTVPMNDKNSDFVNIAVGYVGAETPAVFVDGISGGYLSTEIIYCISNTLRNPLYLSDSQIIKDTVRINGYLSTDIDLDGIVEIPTLSYFPGYNQDSGEQHFITNWNVMDSFSITKKYSSYYSPADGFCFILPKRWDGVVTVKTDYENGDLVFCKYAADLMGSTEELMRLASVENRFADERSEDGYKLLKTRNNTSYFYKLPSDSSEPLVLTESEITNNFYLMT
ncbi:MAG: hypothetical protein IJF18_07075 [Oscillospiraceae bacterium]|nr:hypothetical protein [Oscillospiraceae bacterium]